MPDFFDNTNNNQTEDKTLLDLHEPHSIDIDSIVVNDEKNNQQISKQTNIKQVENLSNTQTQVPTAAQSISISHQNNLNSTISPSSNLSNNNIPNITSNLQSQTISATVPSDSEKIEENTNSKLWSIIKIILILVGIFVFIYVFLNFPALAKRFSYLYQKSTGAKPQVQTIVPETINENLLFLDTVTNYTPENKETDNKTNNIPSKNDLGLSGLENDQLWIPKLDVRAPIVWDSPVDEATMLNNLKYGVVHYKGTTKPGEVADDGKGNVFISGHSSYYWWDDGKYKTIFANLDQLNEGDEIAIGYDDIAYVYKVVEKKEVDPSDVSVLAQNTDKSTLSLMTCVPVGTNLRRLIVRSELIARASDQPDKVQDNLDTNNSSSSQITTSSSATPTPSSSSATNTQTPSATSAPSNNSFNLLPWM